MKSSNREKILFATLAAFALVLFVANLMTGDMKLSFAQIWNSIMGTEAEAMVREVVIKLRLTRALVALVAGAALTVAGLQMQTIFRNPLAEPYLLGVSAGAGLGVSIYLLGISLFTALFGVGVAASVQSFGIAGAAWCGSMAVMLLMIVVSHKVKDIMIVLVLGMMLGSAISSIVMILQYLSEESALKAFVIWTMGSLGDVTLAQLGVMAAAVVAGLAIAIAATKSLNMLLLGENYARTMGLRVRTARQLIFLSTTLLAGTVTAFCGPIGFIGLAVPHIARMIFRSADHRILIPASILLGIDTLLLCDTISKSLLLPINAITSLIGIPIVVVVVLRNRSFNS